MKRLSSLFLLIALCTSHALARESHTAHKHEPAVQNVMSAWSTMPPLGLREAATIDTLLVDYYRQAVPSEVSPAYATTGNLGAEGINMIYFDRAPVSDFFFADALRPWLPSLDTHVYYNTRIPMTLLSYNTGGGRDDVQDRLKATFSGNANSRLQVGAMLDYIYAKGSYESQAVKDMMWGGTFSYIGDRYEVQAYYNHWNMLNKENGGITDDLYITDPAQLQGGATSINAKAIPTRLTAAHTRVVGGQFYMNNRYKIGFYRTDSVPGDTAVHRVYVPVTSFIWTLNYHDNKHLFYNTDARQAAEFWSDTFLNEGSTRDRTTFSSFANTVGIALHEGFNKYAKAGLAAYITYDHRRYHQTADTVAMSGPDRPAALSPYPFDSRLRGRVSENLMWVGAQLTKQEGLLFNYDVTGEIGLIGRAAGEVKVNGGITTRFKLFGDTVALRAYGRFHNVAAPFFYEEYISNHFAWQNKFGKVRTLRFGGILRIPHTGTSLNVGVENIQNALYFDQQCLPAQHSGSVQVFSAALRQNFRYRALHWDNSIIYQTSGDNSVIPLPKLTVYSNLYVLVKIAKVLHLQLGVDCDYYTSYYSPGYQPATMSFYNQRELKVGNYPFMNAYANMKLRKARFYVMFTHVNQGLFGNNYFSMPHYPLNPRKFQLGVSIDFAN